MYEETESISLVLIYSESSLLAEISLFLCNAEPRLFLGLPRLMEQTWPA